MPSTRISRMLWLVSLMSTLPWLLLCPDVNAFEKIMIARDTLVFACGFVGAGKPTLVSSLLTEIPLLSGSIDLQRPWIMRATVKENILMGDAEDPVQLAQVLHARHSLVFVCGSVDACKPTLVSGLLNEIPLLSGSIDLQGPGSRPPQAVRLYRSARHDMELRISSNKCIAAFFMEVGWGRLEDSPSALSEGPKELF